MTTVADVLDNRKSKLQYLKDGFTALGDILWYEFKPDLVNNLSIFRLPEQPSMKYVTEKFVTRVAQYGLKGFDFQIVWPLPENADWRMMRRDRRRAVRAAGLPAGQTIKGNSVFIIFQLPRRSSEPSEAVLRSITRMATELDVQLVNLSSETPPIGNLENIDYDCPGVARIIVSCPDAQALIEKIRPWLARIRWPNGMTVIARSSNFADTAGRETPLPL